MRQSRTGAGLVNAVVISAAGAGACGRGCRLRPCPAKAEQESSTRGELLVIGVWLRPQAVPPTDQGQCSSAQIRPARGAKFDGPCSDAGAVFVGAPAAGVTRRRVRPR